MSKAVAILATVAILAGCNTTNAFISLKPDYSSLPVDDLKQLAASIETIVAEGSEDFTLESPGFSTAALASKRPTGCWPFSEAAPTRRPPPAISVIARP
jgi:hypothetical protein